jgi:hypothetical protein
MKIFTFLLLCSIIIFINAADSDKDCEGASASSAKDCKDLKLSGSGNHCCYSEGKYEYNGKTEKVKICVELTDEEYNNIDDYIDASKEANTIFKIKDLDVDCNSSFLTNSLLGIILFLL